MADRRKKACPNPECATYKRKKFNSTQQFCGQCGTSLVFVCAGRNCFTRIKDDGPKHIRCERCDAERNEKVTYVKEKAGNTLKTTVGAIPATVAVAGKKVMNKEQSAVIDFLEKKGEDAIGAVKGGAAKVAKKVVRKSD